MSLVTIFTPASVAATGPGQPADVSALMRNVQVVLAAKSSAGSSPTLTSKIQTSDVVAVGASYTTEGTTEIKLRSGSNDNIKLGAKFTQDGARTLKAALLKLKRNDTLPSGTLTLELYADSSGPSGSALATATLSVTDVPTAAYGDCLFEFTSTYELADTTAYWLVLTGDYTEHTSNNITWRSKTVASGGNQSIYDSSWSAVATQSFEFAVQQLSFSDLTGGGFTQVGTTGSVQSKDVWIDAQPKWMRLYHTIGGTGGPAFYVSGVAVAA